MRTAYNCAMLDRCGYIQNVLFIGLTVFHVTCGCVGNIKSLLLNITHGDPRTWNGTMNNEQKEQWNETALTPPCKVCDQILFKIPPFEKKNPNIWTKYERLKFFFCNKKVIDIYSYYLIYRHIPRKKSRAAPSVVWKWIKVNRAYNWLCCDFSYMGIFSKETLT